MDASALGKLIASPPPAAGPPAPSRLSVLRYAAWREAERKAAEVGTIRRPIKAFVFPVWRCTGPGADWRPATVIAFEDGGHELRDGVTPGPVAIMAVVDAARSAVVDDAARHPSLVALVLRNRYYAVVPIRRIDGVERIERVIDAPAVARPKHAVPAGQVGAELAIAVGDLDIGELLAKVVASLRAARDSRSC